MVTMQNIDLKTFKNFSFKLFFLSLVVNLISCTYDKAAAPTPMSNGPVISYQNDIKPLMATHCYSCHSATATDPDKISYANVDNFAILKSYALKPSYANNNFTSLQARLRFIETPGMPFKKAPLAESDIKKIESWIKAGAPNN